MILYGPTCRFTIDRTAIALVMVFGSFCPFMMGQQVGKEVFEYLSRHPTAPVIIALRVPAGEKGMPAGRIRSISEIQRRVLTALNSDEDLTQIHRWEAISALAGEITPRGLASVARAPDVIRVDLDQGGGAGDAASGALIYADKLQETGFTGKATVIAVLDSGVNSSHPDLTNNVVGEQCFCRNADGSGCCPDKTTAQSGPGSALDEAGHGTNVTGIIASAGTIAPKGIAPDAKIVAVRVLDSQNRFSGTAQILDGLNWIIANRPDVNSVNMSLLTDRLFDGACDNQTAYNLAFASAIETLRNSGATVFACSGNNGSATQIGSPACVSRAVSVGAVYSSNIGRAQAFGCTDAATFADKIACFTNSNSKLDLLAPGAPVTSTGMNGRVSTYYGTSQATPHAAAGAALLLEAKRALNPDEIEAVLKSTGTPVIDARNNLSFPRIDLLAAVQSVLPHGSFLNVPLSSGGSSTAITTGIADPIKTGSGLVTVKSGSTPYATAVFSLTQNGIVVSETAVPASPPSTRCTLFVDFRNAVPAGSVEFPAGTISVSTGIAAFNYGSQTARVSYTLLDKEGIALTTGHGSVAPRGHFAKYVDQLGQVASDFAFPDSFSTAVQYGSLQISSDQPLSILALRLTTNQRGETLITTTPVADLADPASYDPIYFPQLADGGGWQTSVVLVNMAGIAAKGKLHISDDEGRPLRVQQIDGRLDSEFTYSIPAGGVFVFKTSGGSPTTSAGALRLTPDEGTRTPAGMVIFSYSPGGILVTESGVPASKSTTHARIFLDFAGHMTGLALFNPDAVPISITTNAFKPDGVTPAGSSVGQVMLTANGHRSAFVDNLISGLPDGFTGVLDISSNAPFAPLTLRALNNGRDQIYTTFPAADFSRAAPAPIVFPQVVDGGGLYQTQFILLGTTRDSAIVLNYFDDDGSPMPIIKARQNVVR